MKSTLTAIYCYRSQHSFPRSIIFSGADYISTKTLKDESNRRRRRDGVHDASGEERLGHLQLAALAADLGGRRQECAGGPRAQGVGVALRGARAGPRAGPPRRRAQPAPQRARHALAVLLPRAALARLAAGARAPQGLG